MTLPGRSRTRIHFNADEMNRQRLLADRELRDIHSLNDRQKEILRECFVQKNSPETAAYKLDMPEYEARMWYYRLAAHAVRTALKDSLKEESR
ncbi:MAG: hypothetical protein K6D03_00760 [Solobacterium sp.]|nr:hypothetical protein [Solobacterium sp.]